MKYKKFDKFTETEVVACFNEAFSDYSHFIQFSMVNTSSSQAKRIQFNGKEA